MYYNKSYKVVKASGLCKRDDQASSSSSSFSGNETLLCILDHILQFSAISFWLAKRSIKKQSPHKNMTNESIIAVLLLKRQKMEIAQVNKNVPVF